MESNDNGPKQEAALYIDLIETHTSLQHIAYLEEHINASYTDGQQSQDRTK
jgi:hypothetical protein